MTFPDRFKFDEADLPAGASWDIRRLVQEALEGRVPDDFRAFFDRDPERRPPQSEDVIVAPADGIAEAPEGGRLVIRLRFTDVHVQRVPVSGIVRAVRREGVEFYNPSHPKHWLSVQAVTEIESERGLCVVRQITTLATRRLETYLAAGQRVRAGERLGRIRLGSTVVLELPPGAALDVAEGSRLVGGETVIGRWI